MPLISVAQTWNPVLSGTNSDLESVDFPSASIGYTVGSDGTILKTENGGNTWLSLTSSYPGYRFWDVDFISDQVGYVVGESDPGSNPSGAAIILKTIDGGSIWTAVYNNNTHPLRDLFVVNSNVIYASGGAENIMGAQSKIVKSIDGGVTWNQVGPIYNGAGNAGVVFGGMYFFDADNGIMGMYDFLDQAYLASTTNGCQTLNRDAIVSSISYWNFATDFPTATTGYMTRATYTASTLPSSGDPVYLRKTTDGGLTWSETSIISSASIYDLDFLDASSGYVVGNSGIIKATTDGGQTWEDQTSNTTQELKSVQFVNPNLGFAVGKSGTILRFTNSNLGITEDANSRFDIFPNPSNSLITVAFNNSIDNFSLVNLTGEIVLSTNQNQIDVSHVAPGSYFGVVKSGSEIITKKIVISR